MSLTTLTNTYLSGCMPPLFLVECSARSSFAVFCFFIIDSHSLTCCLKYSIFFFSVTSYILVRCVTILIHCKTIHFICVPLSLEGTTFGIPCVGLHQCHFSPFSNEQGFPEVRRGKGCAFKGPFCLPAKVTSYKVIRASGCCYCCAGQLCF